MTLDFPCFVTVEYVMSLTICTCVKKILQDVGFTNVETELLEVKISIGNPQLVSSPKGI
jgi:hypothetical protein